MGHSGAGEEMAAQYAECDTGGLRDVRPQLWTQMTTSSTAAVETDTHQKKAECLETASG